MNNRVLFVKFDPESEDGTGSFPLTDLRSALMGIGDPFYQERGAEGDDGEGCIETGEETSSIGPGGSVLSNRDTDTFDFHVRGGQVSHLSWDRPNGRSGTLRALWHPIETHQLALIDPSGGGEYPMLFVPSEALLPRIENAWPDCQENGVHVFGNWEGFQAFYGERL